MNKIISICLCALFCVASAQDAYAQAKRKAEQATNEWRYEMRCEWVGVEGTKLIKVWSFSKREKFAISQAKKNAVHGAIFKGFAGNQATGCPAQKPLADSPDLETKKAAFFSKFFADGGDFMKYVSMANNDTPTERVRIGKEYKISVVVTLMYSQLRKDLERAGIIRALSDGF